MTIDKNSNSKSRFKNRLAVRKHALKKAKIVSDMTKTIEKLEESKYQILREIKNDENNFKELRKQWNIEYIAQEKFYLMIKKQNSILEERIVNEFDSGYSND